MGGVRPVNRREKDLRDIQGALRSAGIEPVEPTDPDGTGPAHIVVVDPNGRILVDQSART